MISVGQVCAAKLFGPQGGNGSISRSWTSIYLEMHAIHE